MTVRFHLFPFRTQKLSSLVPKIVRWKRRVKIGSRRLDKNASEEILRRAGKLCQIFSRVYTGMLVSKYQSAGGVQISPPSSPSCFWQNHHIVCRFTLSICGLLLQFQRRTQHCCHCIDNNTENLPQCIRSSFHACGSTFSGMERQPFRIRRYRQLHLSAKMGYILRLKDIRVSSLNFLKICLQNGPCIYTQCFVFDQSIRFLALLNCRFQCSLYCIFVCSELLMPLGQQPVSAVSVNAPPKSKTARLEIFSR